jgi:hypothetical protein
LSGKYGKPRGRVTTRNLANAHACPFLPRWRAPDAIATYSRVLGLQAFLPGTNFGWSDLRNSKQILFWEIK